MKTLIVEDDFTSRVLMHEMLKKYGAADIAVNGKEAFEAVRAAMDARAPYDLICLDIMMPEMDGFEALNKIRELEESRGVLPPHGAKIVMTTALSELENVSEAFRGLCDSYLVKPIETRKLREELSTLGLTA